MKKLLVLILLILCVGCGQEEVMKTTYNTYMKNLLSVNENSSYIPCDIEITYDKTTDNEVSYQITIDNPKENMRNINIVVSHDKETDDGYPSIGVFDLDPINLSVEQTKEDPSKGIVLVGYFKYSGELDNLDAEFKISINYVNDAIEEKTVYFVKSI